MLLDNSSGEPLLVAQSVVVYRLVVVALAMVVLVVALVIAMEVVGW